MAQCYLSENKVKDETPDNSIHSALLSIHLNFYYIYLAQFQKI